MLEQAIALFRAGRMGEAAPLFERALARAPGHPAAVYHLAEIARLGGRPAAAFRLYRETARRLPNHPGVHYNTGATASEAGEDAEAGRCFRRNIALDPAAAGAWDRLAAIAYAEQRFADAARLYARLASLRPEDPGPLDNLGIALKEDGRLEEAVVAHSRALAMRRGAPGDPRPLAHIDEPGVTAAHKLRHDLGQLDYLRRQGTGPADLDDRIAGYEALLARLDETQQAAPRFVMSDEEFALVERSYGRHFHRASTGWAPAAPALSPSLDGASVEADYRRNGGIAVIDGFLSGEALMALRRFCLESTIWFAFKGAGYVGAYFREGFDDPLLLAIANEARERLPGIIGPHRLRQLWAYSYEQGRIGINPHADFAAVNLNFWITPDEANLDPESGGLVVWPKLPPEDWSFADYNNAPAEKIYDFLGADREKGVRVPHRQNRALLFDSRLFHESDRYSFRDGYENRRINITMLFGDR